MSKVPYQPLIYGYLKKYQDDPTSRVFAPLAEAYRKAGLVDEALEIAREGLKVHPSFVGGRVALSRALFDKKMYAEVVAELTPIARDVPDNLAAQRLLAESCLILGRTSEALNAYKMLLFFAPQDVEVGKIVEEIEAQAYADGSQALRTDSAVDPEEEKPSGPSDDFLAGFLEKPAQSAIPEDPNRIQDLKAQLKIKKIEKLQSLLQRIERYRTLSEVANRSRAS